MLGYLQRNQKMQTDKKWAPNGILSWTTIMMISKITNVIEICVRSHLFTVRAKEINQLFIYFSLGLFTTSPMIKSDKQIYLFVDVRKCPRIS